MIAQVQPQSMTVSEYLAWEAEQPIKHEYINGEVYAMAGGTLPHNDIVLNLYSQMRPRLRERGCRGNIADVKVRVSAAGPYFYPDLVVSCDDRDRRATDAVSYPKLIIEVLSPSTAGFDRGDKFRFYRRLATLQEYVLIDAEKVGVDCYHKTSTGKWELTAYPEDVGDAENPILELVSLDFQCPLALVYEEVIFPQPILEEELGNVSKG
jgi:Uma2 family endonuclease